VLFRNARAIVRDPDDDLVLDQIFHAHLCGSIRMAILDGVDQKIADHLLDFLPVRIHINGIGVFHVKDKGYLFLGRFHLQQVKGVLDKFDDVKIFPYQFEFPNFKFGDKIKVLDNVNQSLYPFAGALQVFLAELFILHGPIQKGQAIALHREQGGFEFMGHIAQKVFSVLFLDPQGINLNFFAFGKPFDLFGKGLHVRGNRSRRQGRGFQ